MGQSSNPGDSSGKSIRDSLLSLRLRLKKFAWFGRGGEDLPLTVLIGCDMVYLHRHAVCLIHSIGDNSPGVNVHIHLIDPGSSADQTFARLKTHFPNLTWTCEAPMVSGWNEDARRTYYACARFRVASDLMDANPAHYLILDADSIVRGALPVPTADVGVIFRPKETRERRINASAVFAAPTPAGRAFLSELQEKICERIKGGDLSWYADQLSLLAAYEIVLRKGAAVHRFNRREVDWKLNRKALIWTGKGARKSSTPYLAEAKRYTRL